MCDDDMVIFYCIPKFCGWQPVTREKCRSLLRKVKAFVPNESGTAEPLRRLCGVPKTA
jgi:hypothetical protein